MLCDLEDIKLLGSGIALFFFFLKTVAFNLLSFVCILSIFSLATNLLGDTSMAVSSSCASSYCTFRDNVSDGHKYNAERLSSIESWLGLAAMIVWIAVSRTMRYFGELNNLDIDKNLKTASDYAIKIGNLPDGEYNEEELFEYFQKLNDK
jgi:hypothetical protein